LASIIPIIMWVILAVKRENGTIVEVGKHFYIYFISSKNKALTSFKPVTD